MNIVHFTKYFEHIFKYKKSIKTNFKQFEIYIDLTIKDRFIQEEFKFLN